MKQKTNLLVIFLIISAGAVSSCTLSAVAVKRSIVVPNECSSLRHPPVSFKQSINNPGHYCIPDEEVVNLYSYFRMNSECKKIVEDLIK
jgi:hypothetical protein